MPSDEWKENKRKEIVEDSFALGRKERHGLFSQPISNAIGENNYFPKKTAHKDEETGKPVTGPKNFLTNRGVKGRADDIYFTKPTYIATGDPFKEAAKIALRSSKFEGYKDAGHENDFKPAKKIQNKVQASYIHMKEFEQPKKNYRDEEGAVITAPRNFTTNNLKLGQVGPQTYFEGKLVYMEDDYNRKKALATASRKEHEEKLLKVSEKPFSQQVALIGNFNSDKQVYGEDIKIEAKKPAAKPERPELHDKPFAPSNPSKKGYNKTIAPFPEYKEDPLQFVTRKKQTEEEKEEEKPRFKMTTNDKSRPTPSVVCNMKNLRSAYPSVFKKF